MARLAETWKNPLLNWLLYGNFWIALCALAACWQSHLLLTHTLSLQDPYPWFVACGTLALYSIHRLVGIRWKIPFAEQDRFQIIQHFRYHILLYGLAGAGLAAWLFFRLQPDSRLALLLPATISLLYVTPLFRGRRLRDLPLVKIFLIALAWGMLTAWGYHLETGLAGQVSAWIMLLERMLFIFAITIPFDIRDLEVDASSQVSTLPRRLGISASKRLAYFSLTGAGLLTGLQVIWCWYPWEAALGIVLSLLVAGWLIREARPGRPDTYFSAWLDGTILLQFVLVWAGVLVCPYL